MTRRRSGSGGSALSLGFAAGFAAAGGFAVATAPVFAAGGAGVLPSTGSAIFPLLDLSISFINRDDRQTKFPNRDFSYNFLYFRNPLRVKANSGLCSDLFSWFIFWTAWCVVGGVKAACKITLGREGLFSRRICHAPSFHLLARHRAAGAVMRSRAESFAETVNQEES